MKILIKKEPVVTGCGPNVERYRNLLNEIAGTWQTVETKHLFCDQFNIKTLRVHQRHVEAIQGEVREGLFKCANTGKQSYDIKDIEEQYCMQMQRVPNRKNIFFMERQPSRFIEPPTTGYAIIEAMKAHKVSAKQLLAAAELPENTKLYQKLRRNTFDFRVLQALADFVPPEVFLRILNMPNHYAKEEFGYSGMFGMRGSMKDAWDYAQQMPEINRIPTITTLGVGVNTLLSQLGLISKE